MTGKWREMGGMIYEVIIYTKFGSSETERSICLHSSVLNLGETKDSHLSTADHTYLGGSGMTQAPKTFLSSLLDLPFLFSLSTVLIR